MSLQSGQKVGLSKQSKPAESSEALGSCSTCENDPSIEFKKMKESLRSLFELAKAQLSNLYLRVLDEVNNVSTMLKDRHADSPGFAEKIILVTKQAEKAKQELPSRLSSLLPIPRIIENRTKQEMEAQEKARKEKQRDFISHQPGTNRRLFGSQILNWMEAVKMRSLKAIGPICSRFRSPTRISLLAPKLKAINLSDNSISDLSSLKKVDFWCLEHLNLSKNKIRNLDTLPELHLSKLTSLNLSYNLLAKIQPFQFDQLLELNLEGNKLSNIEKLSLCELPDLQILNLDRNRLTSLDSLKQSEWGRLKVLSFSHNSISSLGFVGGLGTRRLQGLLGHHNKIKSLQPLAAATFPALKEIILHNNQVEDINCVGGLEFPDLAVLDLEMNSIRKKTLGCFVIDDRGCARARKKFPFILV